MNESRKTNGNGSDRRWHRKPALIPLAFVVTLMGFAFGYGQLFGQVQDNADDIAEVKTDIGDSLRAIHAKLNQLFEPRFARRR